MKYFCLMDLEKTLLNDNGVISNKSLELFEIINNYIKIVIVSSSNYNNLLDIKNSYNLNVDLFSSTSMRALINNNEYYYLIDKYCIKDLLSSYKDYIYTAYGEGIDCNFVYNYQDRLKHIYPNNYVGYYINLVCLKVSIYNEYLDLFIRYLAYCKLSYVIIVKDYKKTLLLISKIIFDKEYCYRLASKIYSVKSIGITDSYSDYDMIKNCDIKIGMKNGDSRLKECVDVVSEFDNNSDGCMLALYKIIENE